jgi:hypothetical protein
LLFESLLIRDLRVLAQALDGEVYHYRDDYGVAVDLIVQLRDGRWGAIEIKLGPGQVESAAARGDGSLPRQPRLTPHTAPAAPPHSPPPRPAR